MSYLRAWCYLVLYSAGRQLRSRKTLIAAALLALAAALTAFLSYRGTLTPAFFGEWMVVRLFGLFIFPMVMLIFGTAALGDDREEKTLVYLITRPLSRWGIYAGKLASVIPIAGLLGIGGLWVICRVAQLVGDDSTQGLFERFAEAFLFAGLAYLSLFHFFAVVFRHSMLISIGYVFFVEVFIGNVPGILKRVSIHFYTASMLYEKGQAIGLEPPSRVIFQPMAGDDARWVLAGIAAALLLIGSWSFNRQED